jgi:hypothetical protein
VQDEDVPEVDPESEVEGNQAAQFLARHLPNLLKWPGLTGTSLKRPKEPREGRRPQ